MTNWLQMMYVSLRKAYNFRYTFQIYQGKMEKWEMFCFHCRIDMKKISKFKYKCPKCDQIIDLEKVYEEK